MKSGHIDKTRGSSRKARQPGIISLEESRGLRRDVSNAETYTSTILIAEDDDDTRSMMRCLLEIKGYRVLEAKDGFGPLPASIRRNQADLRLRRQRLVHRPPLFATVSPSWFAEDAIPFVQDIAAHDRGWQWFC